MNANEGLPEPAVLITDVRARPVEGGSRGLELMLRDHWRHGAAWEAIEQHGIGREVVLQMGGQEYYYQMELGEDEKTVYLFPADGQNETLPDDRMFLRKAFHLMLPW